MSCPDENTDKYAVALRIFIIRKSDGTGSVADENYQEALLEEIDDAFNPHGIYFLLNCIDYIDDSFVYTDVTSNTEGGAFSSSFQDDNFVTLVIHGGRSGGGFAPIGGNFAYAGAGYFENGIEKWRSAVVHELGHSLGLYHTFNGNGQGSTPADLVDGSICCDAGDFICDTPADPGDIANIIGVTDCTWPVNPNLTDPNGIPYTGVLLDNYMSYYRFVCDDWSFTNGQGNAMRNVLENATQHSLTKRPGALFYDNMTTVTGLREYDTDVRVLENATARFDGATVEMPAFRKIKVDARARLIGLNSTFTSSEVSCQSIHPFWGGIEVQTDTENAPRYTIVSMGNSTISLANNGIYYSSVESGKPVLPLVFLRGMTFTDNRVALNLLNDNTSGSLENQGFVQVCDDCDFQITANYPLNTLPYSSAVKLGYNRDFWCVDCDLTLPTLESNALLIPAIDVLHTQLFFYTNCPATSNGPNDCEGPGISRSSITNYQLGIRLTNSDNSHIIDASFNNVQHAVLASNSPSLLVQRSQFDINNQGLVNGYAIRTDNSASFVIAKNEFVNSAQSSLRSTALSIISAGDADAFIVDNYFQDFGREVVQAIGVNSSVANGGLSGLRLYCNDFNNPDLGPSVQQGPFDISISNSISTIARFQGDPVLPAGNKFSENIGTNDFHLRNLGSQLVEYVYSNNPSEIRALPVESSGVNVLVTDDVSDCLDFSQDPGGLVANYDTLVNDNIRVAYLESQRPGMTSSVGLRNLDVQISEEYVKFSQRLSLLENGLERDSNSIASLSQLVGATGMRPGYLSRMHGSLVQARYGNYGAHKNFLKTEPIPTSYGADFESGVQQYLNAIDVLGQAVLDNRYLSDLNELELSQLRKVATNTSVGIGGAFAASFLSIYYDEYPSRMPIENKVKKASFESEESAPVTLKERTTESILFPNPATNQLLITNTEAGSLITIYDVQGRILHKQKASDTSTEVNVSQFELGVYLVQFTNSEGKGTTRRFLKN